jgi:hypothetical protein
MRERAYHGGFEHPVRAFVIGVTLLALLFGGFVVGIEAGTKPSDGTVLRVVTHHRVRYVTVPEPVTSTVVSNGRTEVVTLPGSERTRIVVIHRNGRTLVAYEGPATNGTSGPLQTLYVATPQTVTETETGTTVTLPGTTETVTQTVTETDTSPGSSDTGGTTTGP